MRQVIGCIRIILFIQLASTPALGENPATAPSPVPAALGNGKLTYLPPDAWERVDSATTPTTAAYISADHVGILAIQLLPADAVVDSSAGASIVRQLKAIHAKANQKMLLAPTIIKDKRFSLTIHERYEDADGQTVNDELHLYQRVGPLSVMLTVNAKTADSDTAKQIHAIGEQVLLSAHAERKKK